MLRVKRIALHRQPGNEFKDVQFRIDRKHDDRTPQELMELIRTRLPGVVVSTLAASTMLLLERGTYDRERWNTANTSDILQWIGEQAPRLGEIMKDPSYPWAYLLYTNFEITKEDRAALTENVGIHCSTSFAVPRADAWVHQLSMRPGNPLPTRCDIAELLGFSINDEM